MPMNDKERGFLGYLVAKRDIALDNCNHYRAFYKHEEDEEELNTLRHKINYLTGCIDTYFDLIDAYIHTFSDQ